MDCDISDYPHVLAVFRRNRCWGAISKTNGVGLRYRDPIYRTLRELAMSYFHEYFNKKYQKTLRSYSALVDLRKLDPALWVTNEQACNKVHDRLVKAPALPPYFGGAAAPAGATRRLRTQGVETGAVSETTESQTLKRDQAITNWHLTAEDAEDAEGKAGMHKVSSRTGKFRGR